LHQHMSRLSAELVSLLEESERWKKANHNPNNQSLEGSVKKNRTQRSNPLDALASEAQTVALARKMRERLIVNFLKQLILFGVDLVKEDLRTHILRGYARLSEQAKIRQPKSLHYLLQLYTQDGGDVPSMLQYFVDQEKMRSRKRQMIPAQVNNGSDQLDDFLLDTTNNQQLMLAAICGLDDSMTQPRRLTKAQMHLEKAIKDIERIKDAKADKREQRFLEDELKRLKDEQMKTHAKKQVEKIQVEHGVMPLASKKPMGGASVPTLGRGQSIDRGGTILGQYQTHNQSMILDKNGEPLDVKIVKARDID
jgi:DNA repair exonuclease SbcCD ATPase subunit